MGRRSKRIKREGTHIPRDMAFEIMLRLPVSSLLRCRRVNRLWRSITYDPYFINTHLERVGDRLPAILFAPLYREGAVGITYLDEEDDLSSARLKPYFSRPGWIHLNESCNGLVCLLLSDGKIELINPATGQSITPPEPTMVESSYPTKSFLGFHPVTKEYKVIHFYGNHNSPRFSGDKPWIVCEVYTLGSSSWRKICHLSSFPFDCGATVKGVMYWKMIIKKKFSVLCFDLKDERFTRISFPNFDDIYGRKHYNIGSEVVELQGSICVPVFPDSKLRTISRGTEEVPQMDIWMLNHDQWTRKYSLIFPWRGPFPVPLLIHNEKILVFKININVRNWREYVNLLQYHDLNNSDDQQQNVREFKVCDKKFKPFLHVESLVTLPPNP